MMIEPRRRLNQSLRVWSAVALAAVACLATVHASERKPLPAFPVLDAEGRAVVSRDLSVDAQWLIVYATPGCPACDRLLDALSAGQSPVAVSRTIVIVSGEAAAAAAYASARREAAPAMHVYVDQQQGQAGAALGLANGPAVVGIRRGQIEWALTGVLNDPSAVEPAMRAWVEY